MDNEEVAVAVSQFLAKMDRIRMLEALLHEVVERTGSQREGYYSLRRLNDLGWSVQRTSSDLADYLQGLDNLAATLQTEIDRLEVQ